MKSLINGLLFGFEKEIDALRLLLISVGIIALIAFVIFVLWKANLIRDALSAFKTFIVTIFMAALIGSAAFSGIGITNYFTSKGDLVGGFKRYLTNQVDMSIDVDELNFDFKNIVMKKMNNTNYGAEFKTTEKIRLENNQYYKIFVNNMPCNYTEYARDNVVAKYDYVFMDREHNKIIDDSIKISFVFYGNYSRLYIENSSGKSTAGLWNSYFEKENFIVTVKKVDSIYTGKNSCAILFDKNIPGLDENSNFIKLTRVIEGNTILNVPDAPERTGYNFVGWSLDGETVIDIKSLVFNKATTIYAVWADKDINIKLKLNGGTAKVNYQYYSNDSTFNYSYSNKFTITELVKEGYKPNISAKFETDNKKVNLNNFNYSVKEIFSMLYSKEFSEFGSVFPEVTNLEITVYWSQVFEEETNNVTNVDEMSKEYLKSLIAKKYYLDVTEINSEGNIVYLSDYEYLKTFESVLTGTTPTGTLEELEVSLIKRVSRNKLGYELEFDTSSGILNFYRTYYKILTDQYEGE